MVFAVQVGPDKLEVVASFCYLGDMLSAAGGCELSNTTYVKTTWKKFKELLPVLSSRYLFCKTRGRIYSSCERSAMLHAIETWPLPLPLLQDTWPHIQLLWEELNAPCHWDLATDKAKPPMSAAEWQGNDQTDLQCQTVRHCHYQVPCVTCAAWHWGYRPHPAGEKAPLVWARGTLQRYSQDSLWHAGWWKAWAWDAQDDMEAADREGSQRVEDDRHTWRSGVRSAMPAASQLLGAWCWSCLCMCTLITNQMMMMRRRMRMMMPGDIINMFKIRALLLWFDLSLQNGCHWGDTIFIPILFQQFTCPRYLFHRLFFRINDAYVFSIISFNSMDSLWKGFRFICNDYPNDNQIVTYDNNYVYWKEKETQGKFYS